jgi:hypothetical protein
MKRLLAILIATALLGLVPAAQAEAKTFKNCNDLRKTYKYGVSLKKAAVNKGPGPIFTPRVNAAVYRLNKKMDLDRDNIICEVLRPKPKPAPTMYPEPTSTPTPSPTATPSPTPSATPAPSPSPTQSPSASPTASPALSLEEANRLRIPLDPRNGTLCPREGDRTPNSQGELVCMRDGSGVLRWSQNFTNTPAPSPVPTSSSIVSLPSEGSPCAKLGAKVIGNGGFMKCVWSGGLQVDFLKNIIWRFYPIVKVSTSQSNNYSTTPVESAPCVNSGDTFDVAGGILECRWIAGKKLQWIKINTVKETFSNAVSPVSIDICKLQNSAATPDRTGRNSNSLVGFPLINTDRNRMNLKGVNEVLIVPIDFPDFEGGPEVLAQLEYDKKWMTEWYSYFSNGQSKFNVTTVDKWLRMPKARSAYPTDAKTQDAFAADHGRRMADQAQPFIDQITKEVDLRKFSTVYFFYPDGEITFVDFIIRNQWFKAKEGDVQLNLFSWGRNLEAMETPKWAYYIHETMHDFNISMHAPGNGWPLSIGTNQSGISLALNPWEQFLFDWLPADQIYCDDVATLKTATISLSPVEREDRQTKMAVIRLSPTKAIVVESHGIDKWSNFKFGDREFPPGFYSIMAYIVDLNKNSAPPINSDGTSVSNDEWAWAVFQKVQGGPSNEFNINVGDRKKLADYVAVVGDSFVIEGVRIKFVSTGDYETIEISRG